MSQTNCIPVPLYPNLIAPKSNCIPVPLCPSPIVSKSHCIPVSVCLDPVVSQSIHSYLRCSSLIKRNNIHYMRMYLWWIILFFIFIIPCMFWYARRMFTECDLDLCCVHVTPFESKSTPLFVDSVVVTMQWNKVFSVKVSRLGLWSWNIPILHFSCVLFWKTKSKSALKNQT